MDTDRDSTRRLYHGWWVVFCCFVIALYGWGLGFYGLSLYLVALQKLHGWSPAHISAGITFYYIAGAFLVMQVGDVIQKRGGRIVVMTGVALMGLGVIGLSLLREPWQLFIAFAVMIPGWAAMGGGAINTLIAQWFDRRRGFAASLALNGATCAGLLFTPAFAWAIDTLGFAQACTAAVAFVLVTLYPLAAFALRPRHAAEHDTGDGDAKAELPGEPLSRAALLRTPRYLTLVAAFSIAMLAQISFIAHQAAFLEPTLGLKGAGWAISVTSLSALIGRLAVGLIIDRVDRRAATSVILAIQVVSMIVLLTGEGLTSLYLGCILFGFGVGNLITLPGLIVQVEFPRRDFARAVSLHVAITQLVAATGPTILGALHALSGDYRTSLMACLVLQVSAALLILVHPKSKGPLLRSG